MDRVYCFPSRVDPVVKVLYSPGPGCSKLKTSLVNVSLNFQKLISQICQYFFVEKMGGVQKLLSFFKQKISEYLVIKS